MDDVQLYYILDLRQRECRDVGACIVHARDRVVVVRIPAPSITL
jgi:hypothetical protein